MKKFMVLCFFALVSAVHAQDMIAKAAEVLVPAMVACHEYETAQVLRDYAELSQRIYAAHVAENNRLIRKLMKQSDEIHDAVIAAYNRAITTLHKRGWSKEEVIGLMASTGDKNFREIFFERIRLKIDTLEK